MNNLTKQTYNLGRVYAAVALAISDQDTPDRRGTAPLHPLQAAAEMVKMASVQGKLSKALEKEVSELYDSVSPDYPEALPTEEQGAWWLGYYHRKAGKAMTIKAAREKAGLTQEQVAERIGVTQPTYAGWETGKRNPKQETLKKIAAAIGIDVSQLTVE